MASEIVKQLASFSIFILFLRIFDKSFNNGLSFNQIEFAFLTLSDNEDIEPGIPIPIWHSKPSFCSVSNIGSDIA